MKFGSTITGLEDFDRAIERLNQREARNALSRAVNQSVQPALKEARRLATTKFNSPSKESVMGIKKRTLKKGERMVRGLDMAAMVYFAPEGYKLRFWEQGFIRNGRHFPARPMIREALDTQQAEIVRVFGERAGRLISKAAAKRR